MSETKERGTTEVTETGNPDRSSGAADRLAERGRQSIEIAYQRKLPAPKQYAFLGMVAAVSFVVAFGLGSALNIATGIPLIGGLLNGVLVSLLLTLGLRTVERFMASTVMWAIFGLLAIPTVTLGPPGVYKVIPALAGGIVWDAVVAASRGRRWGYVVGGFLGAVVIIIGVFIAAVYLGLPAADRLRNALYFLIPINGALAAFGIWLGLKLWERRLSRIALFRSFGSQ